MRQTLWLFGWLLLWSAGVLGEAHTDGSVGPVRELSGQFAIPQDLGTLQGHNLFHSFASFRIQPGESATFTGSNAIQNVISRVTGTAPSTFNGPLISRVGRADVYFINPNGVSFGPGGSVDVPAAFTVSTASELRFADGGLFSAEQPAASVLSEAAPESYGFLGNQAGQIALKLADVSAAPQAKLAWVGRAISLDGATLGAPAGQIHLTAVGDGTAVVPVQGAADAGRGGLNLSDSVLDVSGAGGGGMTLVGGAVDIAGSRLHARNTGSTPAPASPAIYLQADSLSLSAGSELRSNAEASGRGGAILLKVAGSMGLRDSVVRTSVRPNASGAGGQLTVTAADLSLSSEGEGNTALLTNSAGGGQAGSIRVTARDGLSLERDNFIASYAFGTGATGAVEIAAPTVFLDSGAAIEAYAFSGSSGGVGTVDLWAEKSVTLDHGSDISAGTGGAGQAGRVRLTAGQLSLDHESWIDAKTWEDATGDAGQVDIHSSGTVSLRGQSYISARTDLSGDAGMVSLTAGRLDLSDANITASAGANAGGAAGRVSVIAAGDITLSNSTLLANAAARPTPLGQASLSIEAGGTVTLDAKSSLQANTIGPAAAGRIEVTAPRLIMRGGAGISASAIPREDGSAPGAAGRVVVDAPDGIELRDASIISATARGGGAGGQVELTARRGAIRVLEEGQVAANTFGGGQAGGVALTARRVLIDTGLVGSSPIFDPAQAASAGGVIAIRASDTVTLRRGGAVSTSTYAQGDAGRVTIHAGQAVTLNAGAVSSVTTGAGRGGVIDVSARTVCLSGPSANIETTALAGADGAAGAVRLTAREGLAIQAGGSITSSAQGAGAAGPISIQAGSVWLDRAQITTEAQQGDGGPIRMWLADGGVLRLRDAAITTSVLGRMRGDGGDIEMDGGFLVLETGFIQANTTAPSARGGDIRAHPQGVLSSGGTLTVGGDQPAARAQGQFGDNVIQAAAPDGVNGVIDLGPPRLDVSGTVAKLNGQPIDSADLARDRCDGRQGSSFGRAGPGALPPVTGATPLASP